MSKLPRTVGPRCDAPLRELVEEALRPPGRGQVVRRACDVRELPPAGPEQRTRGLARAVVGVAVHVDPAVVELLRRVADEDHRYGDPVQVPEEQLGLPLQDDDGRIDVPRGDVPHHRVDLRPVVEQRTGSSPAEKSVAEAACSGAPTNGPSRPSMSSPGPATSATAPVRPLRSARAAWFVR